MTEIATFSFATLAGAEVKVVLSVTDPCDGRVLRHAVVSGKDGAVLRGWLEDPHAVPAGDAPFYAALRKRGATHFVGLDKGFLALDAAAARLIGDNVTAALAQVSQIKAAEDARRAETIRATQTVTRVLRHSPAWPDAYGLTEAYAANSPDYAAWVRFSVPGTQEIPVHRDCPSLTAIRNRGTSAGAFLGHTNTLVFVSGADWDILVTETAEMDQRDRQRETSRAVTASERLAALRAIAVPPEALGAFRRYDGNDERAWEAEDETAWSLIRRFGDAIEAQGLAFRRILAADLPIHPPGA